MNFINDTESKAATSSNQQADEYTFWGADEAQQLINEANTESTKVTDELFENRQIPESEFESDRAEPIDPERKKRSERTALFLVETIDQVISTAAANYAKCAPEKLYADKSDLEKIADHFGVYFADKNFDLPPWTMGLVVSAFVLFDKFKMAGELRKANIELEKERARTRDLEAKIKELELQKKAKELQEKLVELEKV